MATRRVPFSARPGADAGPSYPAEDERPEVIKLAEMAQENEKKYGFLINVVNVGIIVVFLLLLWWLNSFGTPERKEESYGV
ncbi:hypothetical protein M427DRAFT_36613 [Gonapodya prolifera JEL478]|uniref:Uncharacterized protein n=1 Tax=Gonapodya prolifera (strain JEL478) TaxID=1344416 RepID=A0A139A348_GONPJ|nr:hypothetical protein M427DRAFT_36613 [Gonapodya prolifera JEL478]|eukprot:KXS10803.1 hypothetical protein M427DRAFT_36613 [Gonapodya prolifera JEL478]